MVSGSLSIMSLRKNYPIEDFLREQGRFKHLFKKGNEHLIEQFQEEVDRRWEDLRVQCSGYVARGSDRELEQEMTAKLERRKWKRL